MRITSLANVTVAIVLAIATLGLLGTATTAYAQQPILMKVGAATVNDPKHHWMRRFAEEIEKRAPGRFKIELYPASQLGNTPRLIELAQVGAVQIIALPPEFLAGLDPRFDVLCAPGLFHGDDLRQVMIHANRAYQDEEFNRAFLNLGSNKGLVGIAIFPAGPSGMVFRTRVASAGDIKGRKIRVLGSAMQEAQIRSLGATPTSMPLGEVVPALQQGAIDGAMSTLPVFAGFHTYDAAKYFLNTSHMVSPDGAFASKLWFDKLPPDLQKVVRDVSKKITNEMVEPTVAFYESAQQAWTKGGGEIMNLSAAARAEMLKPMATIGNDLASRQSASYKSMYELLIAAAKRNKETK